VEYIQYEDRAAYEARQIAASTGKIGYCKVSYRDPEKYVAILRNDKAHRKDAAPVGPVLCLGVRNGREVDLFRVALTGSPIRRALVRALERRHHGFRSHLPVVEQYGRHSCDRIVDDTCLGVELNPIARRADVWIGSYDALPKEWSSTFGVVYCNALDHAFDPWVAAAEWRRVIRPGGYMVLDYPEAHQAAALDPVEKVRLPDVLAMFPGELVYYSRLGSAWGYTEYVVRL